MHGDLCSEKGTIHTLSVAYPHKVSKPRTAQELKRKGIKANLWQVGRRKNKKQTVQIKNVRCLFLLPSELSPYLEDKFLYTSPPELVCLLFIPSWI